MALTRGQEARAWVNFNGTGTVAIRDSFNVSSITDNGTGDYTVNFDQAMPNANYNCISSCANPPAVSVNYAIGAYSAATMLTTSVRVFSQNGSGTDVDLEFIGVAIFGDPS